MAPITRKTLNNTQNGGTQQSNISEDLEKTLSDSNSKIDSDDEFYADCDENDEPAGTSDANCPKCKVEVNKDDPALRGGQLLNYWGCAFTALGMPNLPPEEKI